MYQYNKDVTRLYDGLTYLQNNKVDFRFYQLLKDLFKYYYVEADVLNFCVIYKKRTIRHECRVTFTLRSRLYRLILISILTVIRARKAFVLTFHILTMDQMGFLTKLSFITNDDQDGTLENRGEVFKDLLTMLDWYCQ